jgi:hypothetical protein
LARNIDVDFVDESLEVLSISTPDLVLESSTFFFEPTDLVYKKLASGDEKELGSVAGSIASHIRIVPTPQVTYDWGVKMDLEVAGEFSISEVSKIIRIPFFYVGRQYCTGAILAHEMAHAFLTYRGIVLNDPGENEAFTDIASVYVGLGKLMLNGLFYVQNRYNGSVYSLGYLPLDLALYCYVKVCAGRGIPNDFAVRHLTPDVKQMIDNNWKNYCKNDSLGTWKRHGR